MPDFASDRLVDRNPQVQSSAERFPSVLSCQKRGTCPGMITWAESPSEETLAVWARLADQTPVKRTSLPHDYVTATVFLSSRHSGFVHGSNIVVDGGWSSW